MRAAVLAAVLTACAPAVDGPVEQQAALDRTDEQRLAEQLGALPGVTRAEVVLRRAVRDPLTTLPPRTSATSIVLVVDDKADRARLEAAARSLARALVAGTDPAIVVEVGARRADLARVGPFTVEAASKPALKATLAIILALLAALAGYVAWTSRRRSTLPRP